MAYDFKGVLVGRVWRFGDSIDTDTIYPHYRYSTEAETRKHVMETVCPEFPVEVRQGDIVVAGRNFGCGSSRPGGILRDVGVVAIVAELFSRLFFRNCVSQAISVFVVPGVSALVETGETLEIDYPAGEVRNPSTGKSLNLRRFPEMVEGIYATGGILALAHHRHTGAPR